MSLFCGLYKHFNVADVFREKRQSGLILIHCTCIIFLHVHLKGREQSKGKRGMIEVNSCSRAHYLVTILHFQIFKGP